MSGFLKITKLIERAKLQPPCQVRYIHYVIAICCVTNDTQLNTIKRAEKFRKLGNSTELS